MLYERIRLPGLPKSVFAYACWFDGANHIQIGLGYASVNGLQLRHVPSGMVPAGVVGYFCEQLLESGTVMFDPGPLEPLIPVPVFQGEVAVNLADAIKRIHHKVWQHPLHLKTRSIEFDDGVRFVWLTYDETVNKIRLGIGFIKEDGDRVYGDTSFHIGKRSASQFAADLFTDPHFLQFFGVPPHYPFRKHPPVVSGAEKKQLAAEFLRLADEAWPGGVGTESQSA